MRPKLHPEMGIVPISARVAVQLTRLEYDTARCTPLAAGVCVRQVLTDLPLAIDGMVRLALHSLGVYLDMGFTEVEWLREVLKSAHLGNSFRRCFFFEYKENRRAYPRVTNRGVPPSRRRHWLAVEGEEVVE